MSGKMDIYKAHEREVSRMVDDYPPLAEVDRLVRETRTDDATPTHVVMSTDVARQLRKRPAVPMALLAALINSEMTPEQRLALLRVSDRAPEGRKRASSIIADMDRYATPRAPAKDERVSKRARRRARGKGR